MIRGNSFTITLLALCLLIPMAFIAGHPSSRAMRAPAGEGTGSHGGDLNPGLEDTAWFTRWDQSIRYCVDKLSPKFPYNEDFVAKRIEAAFAVWEHYYKDKIFGENALAQLRRYDPSRPGLTFKTLKVPCSGSPAQPPDLIFYLGKPSDPAVATRLKKSREFLRLSTPIAMAVPATSGPGKGGKPGFIWFSDPATVVSSEGKGHSDSEAPTVRCGDLEVDLKWTERIGDADLTSFDVMLRHEIGHVLGNSHHRGTIMDESIAVRLLKDIGGGSCYTSDNYPLAPLHLAEIDQEAELASKENPNIPGEAFPYLRGISVAKNWGGEQWFPQITGFHPTEALKGRLLKARSYDQDITLEFENGAGGESTLKFESDRYKEITPDTIPFVFRIGMDGGNIDGFQASRFISFGKLVDSSGQQFDATVERNNDTLAPFFVEMMLPRQLSGNGSVRLYFGAPSN